MERGDFREDLYYRLQVFEIRLPPLRERPEDILPLSDAFLRDIGHSFGRPPAGMTREARQALLTYRWPGNVRELRNVLERAAIVCEGGLIAPEHLSFQQDDRPSAAATTNVKTMERQMIEQVLRESGGNKSKAARKLGLTRKQLYVRLRQYETADPDLTGLIMLLQLHELVGQSPNSSTSSEDFTLPRGRIMTRKGVLPGRLSIEHFCST